MSEDPVWPIEELRKRGAIGGRAGRGASKRRPRAHYQRMAQLALIAKQKKREAAAK